MEPTIEDVLLTRQTHLADVAGKHYDWRIVVGDKALSWATKKETPKPGQSILLHEQPVHTAHYALSEKVEIPKGNYGAGTTTLDFVRKAKLKKTDKYWTIESNGEKYLLKQLPANEVYGDKAWLFRNLTKPLEKEAATKRHSRSLKDEVRDRVLEHAVKKAIPKRKSRNKYLEKVAILLELYQNEETGQTAWKEPGWTSKGWKSTGKKFHKARIS